MKTISIALRKHYAQGSTTLARCWRFECSDGTQRRVTTAARDLLIDGEVYFSKDGVNPTAIEGQVGAAVPNSEVTGTLAPDLVTETQILAAKWDAARVEIFEVNYRDLSMGRLQLQTGTVGDLKVGRSVFSGEVRGLAQALQQVVGRTVTKNCTADLGDARCKVNVEAMRVFGTFTAVASRRNLTDSTRTEAADWFGAGVLRIESGEHTGTQMEVNAFDGGVFDLSLPFPFNPEVGMSYSAIPGCRKRHDRNRYNPAGVSDCVDKFDNILNNRGFGYVPGSDKVLGLGGTEGTNL